MGMGAPDTMRTCTSTVVVGWSQPGSVSTCPRSASSCVVFARFTATRLPGPTLSMRCWCDCKPRMRRRRPDGSSSTSWPTVSAPSSSVPVTTVPKPGMTKLRSMERRGRPRSSRRTVSSSMVSMRAASSGRPWPVTAETRAIGAPCSVVPASASSTSPRTRPAHSSSTVSALVSTTMPRLTWSRSRMARCSRVWGMTDSSAATMSMARSMPPTPASMFLMKRSWPGTSTTLISRPEGSVNHAKPSSMVISRSFSSWSRSGSMPVSALTSVDLPWSTWPAVPMTYMRVPSRGGAFRIAEGGRGWGDSRTSRTMTTRSP